MTAGIAEYLLESKLWPLQLIKQQQLVAYAGLFLVVLGEVIRKLAMVRLEPPCKPLALCLVAPGSLQLILQQGQRLQEASGAQAVPLSYC